MKNKKLLVKVFCKFIFDFLLNKITKLL